MQQVDIFTRKIKLQGTNVTKIVSDYQKANSVRADTIMTQQGIENLMLGRNEQMNFTLTHQHYLNSMLDVIYVPSDSNYDYTYNIHVEKSLTSFRYQEDALSDIKSKVCYMASTIIDENCEEYGIAMAGSAGEEVDVLITDTGTTQQGSDEYVKSFKIRTKTGDPFKHTTLITFGNYFFSTEQTAGVDSTAFILVNSDEVLYTQPECDESSRASPEVSYYPTGWKYTAQTYYRIIPGGSEIFEFEYSFPDLFQSLLVDNFDSWLSSKILTTTTLDPINVNISDTSVAEQVYISKDLKDINFVITKELELYYPKPRLLNITVYGENSGKAPIKMYVDETYAEASLEKTTTTQVAVGLNVNELHISGKYFDGITISEAQVGDFGSWANIKCTKLVIHNLGQLTTVNTIRQVLLINSTNIPTIEFVDSI